MSDLRNRRPAFAVDDSVHATLDHSAHGLCAPQDVLNGSPVVDEKTCIQNVEKRAPWWQVVTVATVCGFVGVACYSNAFNADFVFDDNGAIVENPGTFVWGVPRASGGEGAAAWRCKLCRVVIRPTSIGLSVRVHESVCKQPIV